jgi:Flp pilus assembly protein TadD
MAQMPEERRQILAAMQVNAGDPNRYVAAVRDWVANGAASRHVLSPEQVVERSRPRPAEAGLAAAHFDLGSHLYRTGHGREAVAQFQQAHELDPTNWSYQRQARSLVDPEWGEVYERDLFAEVGRVGAETWRPPLDL